jgi:voltage-gated potassium channel Kch
VGNGEGRNVEVGFPDRQQRARRGRHVPRRVFGGPVARRRAKVHHRLRYRFDNSLARGPLVLIGWLGVAVLLLVVLATTAAAVTHVLFGGGRNRGVVEDLWQGLRRVLDASAFGNDTAWPARLMALFVTLFGIFIGGSLIGLIATALDQRVDLLRKGRSAVLESNHTLILGWSARLPVIVQELVVANQNAPRPVVVILAKREKAHMEAELRDRTGDTGRTKVVCRSGDPGKPADLVLANIAGARSTIILVGDEGDAGVVKTILAVKTLDPSFAATNVVAELAHPDHARTVRAIADGAIATVNSDDVIADVTAQACHQTGLSVVLRDLLDFEGDECYFAVIPELEGHTYAEALGAFETSSVIGRYSADGFVELSPPPDSVFGPGDEVIAVSADDDTVIFTGFRDVPVPDSADAGLREEAPIRVLIVGWSAFAPKVVHELDAFLAPGSHIEVCINGALADPGALSQVPLANVAMTVTMIGDGPEHLLALGARPPFDQVIVLGYRDGLSVAEADSLTLLTLLTLRKVWPPQAMPRVPIIAQLLDQSNVELATSTGVDDFIVSDALASLMLAQLSQRRQMQAVFDELFDPGGAGVELQPASRFVTDHAVGYAEIVAAGAAQGVSVLGWRISASGEVVINPKKTRTVQLGADDQVLVVVYRAT